MVHYLLDQLFVGLGGLLLGLVIGVPIGYSKANAEAAKRRADEACERAFRAEQTIAELKNDLEKAPNFRHVERGDT